MKIECTQGSSGRWSWRLKGANGQVVAEGTKTYADKGAIAKGVQSVADAFGKNLTEVTFEPLEAPKPAAADEGST